MVKIQSKEVIDKIHDELKVQPAAAVPTELSKDIQLTYDCNPLPLINIESGFATDSTTDAIMTTSSTKDTWLIGASISVSKDAVNTSIHSSITATPFGKAQDSIIALRYEPTTAGSHHHSVMFPIPIKLERGSAIAVNNNLGLASIDTSGKVFYYETDPQ